MSRETTSKQRAAQVIRLLDDKVAALTFKESYSLVYNYVMYEYSLAMELRHESRRAKYGRRMQHFMDIANFKHQLQDL